MQSDLEKLQGAWRITALESDGRAMQDIPRDARIVVKGETFVSTGMGAEYTGTIQLDSTKAPKRIDLVFVMGPESGARNVGIYDVDGDTWRLCLATSGTKRPRTFATRAGTGVAIETLERERAGTARRRPAKASVADRAPAAPKPPDTAGSGPRTELEGEWKMVSAVFSGAPMDKTMVEWCRRVTNGNLTTVLAGPQVMLKATFTLDASVAPRAIDYVNVGAPNKGKRQAGIYELTGGTLRICMAAPGKPRPREFASAKGDGRSFTTWSALPGRKNR
jgi:uncharacterized protein (TIGR03067 family)